MSFDSTWPALLCVLVWFGLAWLVPRTRSDQTSAPRVTTLDGLRGFLALGVFLYHSSLLHQYMADHSWQPSANMFFGTLGGTGIYMFFMTTGFLFWGQVVRAEGRLDWRRFYVGRLFRIAPIYLLAITGVFLAIAVRSNGQLHVAPSELATQIGTWLALGLLTNPPLNGVAEPPLLLVGATWTLRYEWLFYLALPLLAFGARRRWMALPFSLLILVAGCLCMNFNLFVQSPFEPQAAVLFAIGMVTAVLHHTGRLSVTRPLLASCLVVVLMSLVFLDVVHASLITLGLIGGSFCLIASGATMFGALVSRAAIRLGMASYGIYLLQGVIFSAVVMTEDVVRFAVASPWRHWSVVVLSGIALISLAGVAHVLIETPCIATGKRLTARPPR